MNKKVTRGLVAAAATAAMLFPMNAAFAAEYSYTMPDGVVVTFNADDNASASQQLRDYVAAVNNAQGTNYTVAQVTPNGSTPAPVTTYTGQVILDGAVKSTSPALASTTALANWQQTQVTYWTNNGYTAVVDGNNVVVTSPRPTITLNGKSMPLPTMYNTVDEYEYALRSKMGKDYTVTRNGNDFTTTKVEQTSGEALTQDEKPALDPAKLTDGYIVANPNKTVTVSDEQVGDVDEYMTKLASKYGKNYFVIRYGKKINVVPTNGQTPAEKVADLEKAYGKNYKVTNKGNIITVTRIEQTSGDPATADEKPALDPAKLTEAAKPAEAAKLAQTGADVTVMSAIAAVVAVAAGAALTLKRKFVK